MAVRRGRWGPRLPLRAAREGGFTLVELAVASGVVLVALILIASIHTRGLSVIGLSRQRQSAAGILNQTIERIRALPFDTLARGLDTTDLANTVGVDADITNTCGATYCYNGERIVHANNAALDPLVPHIRTVTSGPTTFQIKAYVTRYDNVATTTTFRATVVVTWSNPQLRSASGRHTAQTIVTTPTGCLSTTVHPFAGPCQAGFTSNAVTTSGQVTISGALTNIPLEQAVLWMPRQSSDLIAEQITSVTSLAQSSGVSIKAVGAADQVASRAVASSGANNDPAQGSTEYTTSAVASQSATSRSLTAGAESVSVALTAGDTGRSTSTTRAKVPARLCPNVTGTVNEDDDQACGGAEARQAATLTATATMLTGGATLGPATLARVSAHSATPTAVTDRNTSPAGTVCPGTSGAGCSRGRMADAGQEIIAADLPANIAASSRPPGWLGRLVRFDGISGQATATAGIGVGPPTATALGGTVQYYSGGAYITVTASSIASTITIPTVTVVDPGLGATISMSGTISPGSRVITDPANCGSNCIRENASATVNHPTATITYEIRVGSSVDTFTIVVVPGALLAKATYTPPPAP